MKGDKLLIEKKCKELGLELIDENFDYDKNRDSVFKVKCLKCGKVSTKRFTTLVKGNHGCKYCRDINRDYHNTLYEVMPKILDACKVCDYTFIDFDGGKWKKCRDTKLILKCNKCGKVTCKNYDNFINKKSKCICYRCDKAIERNILDESIALSKINKVCKTHNFTFISFISSDKKYHNNKTFLKLKCNKCGKIVKYTFNHFTNRDNILCKHCTKSSLENQLKQKLINENIEFEEQKRFDWLKYKNNLSLDFYLPKYKLGIECQGIQHYKPLNYFGGKEAFKNQVKRDKIKFELCKENGIKILYISSNKEIEEFKIELK